MSEGIAYYIPPELRRMGKSAIDLLSAIDPAQGIMRGMAASGRAFDSDLSADERKAAAIEAGVETLFPIGMIGMGAAAKQPAKAVLMDILTPTGATKDIAEDTLADPSRRKFLQGAAAAVPVAAIAPDVITDVMTKATKAGGRAAINPLDMAMANIKELRRQIDEGYAIVNEVLDNPRSSGPLPDEVAAMNDANKNIQTAELEIIEEAYDAIMMMDKADFADAVSNASDEALEAIIEPQYESIMGNQRLVDDGENSVRLAQEAHRRGLHLAKDKNGIDRFPNARAFVEDFYDAVDGLDTNIIPPKNNVDDGLLDSIGVYRDDGNLNMARQTPPDIQEDITQLKLTELRRQIEQADRVMRIEGKSTKEIDEFKAQKRREMFELQNLPPDMDDFYAKGGAVEGVGSLSRVARDMFRGPRGIATLSRFAEGGAVVASDEALEGMRSKVMKDYGFDPVNVAIEEGVDPELLLRVMYTENKGRQGPKSPKGAIGLMQLMPDTAAELGVDPNDPEDNTRGGARYLKQMLAQFESIPLALAAYNAGPGNVNDYGGIPPFAETQNYVRQIAPALTGADVERQIEDSSENYLMSQPVAAAGDYSPMPQLRPFDLKTYTGPTVASPRPVLREETEEQFTQEGIPSIAGVIPGRKTDLYQRYGGIASLTNP